MTGICTDPKPWVGQASSGTKGLSEPVGRLSVVAETRNESRLKCVAHGTWGRFRRIRGRHRDPGLPPFRLSIHVIFRV